jgi:FkbM family methyltransferase
MRRRKLPKLSGLVRTIKVAKTPFLALSLKSSKNQKRIVFRNGFEFDLNWRQFRDIRDNYHTIKKSKIIQVDPDGFQINGSNVISEASRLHTFCRLMQKYDVQEIEPGFFRLKNSQIHFEGDINMLGVIEELEADEYNVDFRDKTVLDIGGFEGETAVFFWSKGAKKIVIYEPVERNQQIIQKNLALNHVNAELHNEGIAESDGTTTVYYKEINPSFGFKDNMGNNTMEIRVKSVSKVLKESNADIAKLDCEGAEQSLIKVTNETLREIPFYIIETHSPDIRQGIINKFEDAGFSLIDENQKSFDLSVLVFQRN